MSRTRTVLTVAVLAAAAWAVAPVAEAQKPIRIGSTLSLTGTYLAIGQKQPAADFSVIPRRLGALDPDVLAPGTYLADAVRRLGKTDTFVGRGPTA